MKFQKLSTTLFSSLLLGLTVSSGIVLSPNFTLAQDRDKTPDELTELLKKIDRAASRQDLEDVMDFYSNDFTNSDGLNRESLSEALSKFWQLYKSVEYRTEVKSWEIDGDAIVAETVTYITGVQQMNNRNIRLKSTITSQQRYEDKKIVEQEILAERNQLTSGKNPPTINVNLPLEVEVGKKYNFDVIVAEPLGEQIMLGAAWEEPINENSYDLEPANFQLELLPSGGIFKIGEVIENSQDQWLSAVLMRKGGITISTYRLRVLDK
ncbi:MAG: nuclear transport factor 2 family protein [Okeania sp. SIO2G4]|nr:nuclear transport factor 2 family protein [Okeania sp. SIO2G5]NEP96388.1 nuclear transport factor 2 family protein [Okeania sp. SIO2F5]NEQ94173.1 nuclear transport factor 2 family protein [Okeania sp. SIO2G4]